MRLLTGNLFDHIGSADAVGITTNGFVKANGHCVMGKGCARTASNRWPQLPAILGQRIADHGNVPIGLLRIKSTILFSFPVKPRFEQFDGTNAVRHMKARFDIGDTVPGWACLARIDIIIESAKALSRAADRRGWTNIILPRPGCGAGGLRWSVVQPELEFHLDNRFGVITFR